MIAFMIPSRDEQRPAFMQCTSGSLNSNAVYFLNCGGTLIETIPGRLLGIKRLTACSASCGLGRLFETVIFPSVILPTLAGLEISSNAACRSPAGVISVGKKVVKLDNLIPGIFCMDALDIKFSVK